jgi:hypothetical protein
MMLTAAERAGQPAARSGRRFNVSDAEREKATRAQTLVCKKLLEIMDLQADIDVLVRDKHPTGNGLANALDFGRFDAIA